MTNGVQSVIWSPDLCTQLAQWWKDGYSAGQISKMIPGSTRSGVIGKIHRLGLGKKDVEAPRVKSEYKRPSKPKTTPLLFVRPPYVPPPVITLEQQRLHSRSYSDLGDHMCKWPLYYEGEVQMYCAAPVEAPRKPYCECHTEMAKPPRNAIRGPYKVNRPSATRFR